MVPLRQPYQMAAGGPVESEQDDGAFPETLGPELPREIRSDAARGSLIPAESPPIICIEPRTVCRSRQPPQKPQLASDHGPPTPTSSVLPPSWELFRQEKTGRLASCGEEKARQRRILDPGRRLMSHRPALRWKRRGAGMPVASWSGESRARNLIVSSSKRTFCIFVTRKCPDTAFADPRSEPFFCASGGMTAHYSPSRGGGFSSSLPRGGHTLDPLELVL
ncbi:hypothetical protein JHW43_003621 [Diplocarpon mali]|nr:hypothetical protein JHW43_003621 [Diplocarpon mali]